MSLGARPEDVLRLVVSHGLALAVAGAAPGLALAAIAAGLVRGFLHVSPLDPRVLAASAASAVLMGVLASLAPALRALRIDPARVLRLE
jgi:putative ABC transport system permease protein